MEMIRKIGNMGINFIKSVLQFLVFLVQTVHNWFSPPYYPKIFLRHVIEIGFYSLPVVSLTALFAGMVLALQSYSGFASFSAEGAVATVVEIAITRELGPVFAGLMVAGSINGIYRLMSRLQTGHVNSEKCLWTRLVLLLIIACRQWKCTM